MGDRDIDEEKPEQAEQEHGAKADALDNGADNERRRDDGERHLEHEEHGLGNGGVGGRSVTRNPKQHSFV
jgi:hypothetical protein